MKSSKSCPKCSSKKIGYIETVMDEIGQTKPAERKLAETLTGSFWQMSPREEISAVVEAYVCTECGYFEEYVKKPGAIKWEKLKQFKYL